jgi:hypothetical protein
MQPTLVPLVLFAIVAGVIGSAAGAGLLYVARWRLAPALLAVLAGPLAAFVLQVGTVVYLAHVEALTGADYLGTSPVAVAGYVSITMAPSLIAAGFVVLIARRHRHAAPNANSVDSA